MSPRIELDDTHRLSESHTSITSFNVPRQVSVREPNGPSLVAAAGQNALLCYGEDNALAVTMEWKQYDQHQMGGPWNYKKYVAGQTSVITKEADILRADVEEFGSETVEKLRRRQDPTFKLPPSLKGIVAGGKVAATEVPKVPELAPAGKGDAPKKAGAVA